MKNLSISPIQHINLVYPLPKITWSSIYCYGVQIPPQITLSLRNSWCPIEVCKIRLSCFLANFALQNLHFVLCLMKFDNLRTLFVFIQCLKFVNSETGDFSTVFCIHFKMKVLHLYFLLSSRKKNPVR